MAKKGRKSTPQEAEAGRQNLLTYREENPTPALKHGAYSHAIRQRYGDKRYREGKQLATIMSALIDDLGGQDKVTASQRLILDNIKAKIVVIFQISAYVDRQPSIINEKGELLPCLGRNFTGYSEALRRDLEALASMASKKPSKILTIDEIISQSDRRSTKSTKQQAHSNIGPMEELEKDDDEQQADMGIEQ